MDDEADLPYMGQGQLEVVANDQLQRFAVRTLMQQLGVEQAHTRVPEKR